MLCNMQDELMTKLESQVCSLELAKKLKELGVKQDSYFYYGRAKYLFNEDSKENIIFCNLTCMLDENTHYYQDYSAFTVADLGEMLPEQCMSFLSDGEWLCCFGIDVYETSNNEADARAKMLIYLLENNMIKLSDIAS